ncbi:uncharacterized protein LOC118274745 isoform X1 [Spodoptera frugiperda]|uniref:Uncharacterized protein LOC118274745 isoform X1 n=1 Tax=Spodoptera frugiperda TaxID=7108 RepID=A0A9R0DCR8_SPOFR|nr:uncharacterized protein LOC118274745 isoform X1 [Spodoptera frugiperda]XP_035448329.2 uncharacterized protein LOC118274745 isoform X1 [Spodoptera frugiperda]
MSPRKSVKNQRTKRNSTEKLQNKKEKPKFNMPTNIKVSIPIRNNIGNSDEGIHFPIVRGKRPPQFKKLLDTKTKVDLANEVARQQLIKEEPPKFHLDNIVIIQNPVKRGRKKKITDFFNKDREQMDNNAENAVTSTNTKSQKLEIKVPAKPTITRRIVTRKRLADSTANSQPSAKKAKVDTKIQKTDIKTEMPTANDEEMVPDSNPIVAPQVKPASRRGRSASKPLQSRANNPAPKSRAALRRGSKGKQGNADPANKSPPIPDQPKKLAKKETENENAQQFNSAPIDSRKTSVSSCSNLSWTKDISSSSNTTCITACSNDFVRINKKLPMLVLKNIDNKLKNKQASKQQLQNQEEEVPPTDPVDSDDSSSDSSDSDSSDSEENDSEPINDIVDANSLNLSSSSQPSSHIPEGSNKQNPPDYTTITDTLIMLVDKLDMEIINWISSENEQNNANLVKFKDKMFDILDNEFGVISHCSRLKHILDPDSTEDAAVECIPKIVERAPVENIIPHKDAQPSPVKESTKAPEKDFVEPRPVPLRKLSINLENYASSATAKVPRDEFFEDEMQAGTSRNNYSYDHHDDDDALSLYAESITGFESSRMNTSIASYPAYNARPVEEYVPRPVTEVSPPDVERHTYLPTKIADTEGPASKIKSVIEKQNADSTSIYKQSNSTEDADAESYEDFSENIELNARVGPPDVEKRPRLMDSIIERTPRARSIVFANLCFYNLLNTCRKVYSGQCRFPHVIPTCEQITAKLGVLDERLLIQEYMLLRNWTTIRRRFGLCYVEECAKRGLTRILVEMAYDFIVKARNDSEEDTRIRVNTIEITLLHLNSVDLCICEDLLKLPVHADQGNRTLLCDVFMATMSITQNFSRFKIVFLTLTYFMVDNDRTFNKDVVEHILERVCILPFEEPIAKALIQMMRLTNCAIFSNSMIRMFEKQISVNKDVLEEYMLLKNQYAFSSMLASSMIAECSQLKLDKPQSVQSDAGDGQPPAASPDTTNISNVNQPSDESPVPVITRTIGMGPPITFNHSPTKQRPSYDQESPGGSRPSFVPPNDNSGKKYWRHRSVLNNIMRPPTGTPRTHMMRPPMLPQMRPRPRPNFNQRLVTFRSPSSYMNRPSGPKY